MNLLLNIAIYLLSSTLGLLLLKTSVSDGKPNFFSLLTNYKFLFGFLLYAISFLSWILLLSKKDLTFIYPIVVGLSYIVILTTSIIFLHEEMTYVKIIAALFIGCGIILFTLNK
jgi:multidrug transporter EmrE-like cation transporter